MHPHSPPSAIIGRHAHQSLQASTPKPPAHTGSSQSCFPPSSSGGKPSHDITHLLRTPPLDCIDGHLPYRGRNLAPGQPKRTVCRLRRIHSRRYISIRHHWPVYCTTGRCAFAHGVVRYRALFCNTTTGRLRGLKRCLQRANSFSMLQHPYMHSCRYVTRYGPCA